ncbi:MULTISPECIES: type IV conjugative transfer system lipoprotein TraV [Gammaproteobacteria]|uniref:Type IV conjugative transfer system lipoprotein TraV n=2 Tax=Gammaproteobacteria TaxID=1236 RepID=A0ABX7V5P0_9GAMM|nr:MULTISPECIES: type IV conjugative transfer system lipoprotein TraV [Gammaproteobacteria]HDS6522762.1 type IV conjugative transfer system lipoprotein TraV [Proteus mirabilis]KFE06403.1 type IV conjugative transfer system protein TraV [Vibrio cholerae]MDW4533451.1 type IV conjugative transfer system lipoprotein TraV [Vibrio cholerae]QTL35820.1 type IV conjugative transfer system lipoprotein TraV [Pseudoalteromonas viridis]GHZ48580.1 conjugative transfer protein TraV [Vibrio cholerae]
MTTSMQNNSKHQPKQWSKAGLLLLAVGSTLLSGCSSLGLGSSEYGCPGMPDGVRCLSAREVYELTSNGAAPKTIDAVATRIGSPSGYSQSDLETGLLSHPALPETQQSAPLRIPSRVMRIWIAPWEDDRGDLNLSSYVFTEIEPRRWDIGVSAPRTVSPVLRPLQTQSDSASAGADGKRDNLSIYGETNE